MAVYKLFPIADSAIYSGYPSMNTGLDEILDTSTNFTSDSLVNSEYPQASRFLVKFSLPDIVDVINNKVSGSTWSSNLKCYISKATGLTSTSTLNINALYEDWNMGTGRYLDSPETQNGVSWVWKDYYNGTKWTTSSYDFDTTGSYNTSTNPSSPGGGTWYISPEITQSFSYYTSKDIDTDVTSIVTNWYTGTYNNYGFIVRQSSSQEFIDNINQQVELKYFSRDTHTIYPPCLEFKWTDSVYNTGSLTVLNTLPASVLLSDNPGVFYPDSVNTFRVNSRPEYPPRVWQTTSVYTTNYALPENSYYAVKDLDTNEFIVDFDSTYTKLSCDPTGSYFTLYMNGLQPERYYKILIKTTIDTSTLVFDNDYIFKVVNG